MFLSYIRIFTISFLLLNMKELVEFHFFNPTHALNLHLFLIKLGNKLRLTTSELHRIKVVAGDEGNDLNSKKISFYVLFNIDRYHDMLKLDGCYIGQWRWEVSFGELIANVLFPPRGNAGFISYSLHHDEPRKEVAIKNSSNWSLFYAIDVITRQMPGSSSRINSISLANEIIFIQFHSVSDVHYFLIHFTCDATITFAHSRSKIVIVDNYPIKTTNMKKRCLLDRLGSHSSH